MKVFFAGILYFILICAAFAAGLWVAANFRWASDVAANPRWVAIAKDGEYWLNRYQTFAGVLVAIAVAYFTLSATGKQIVISERQVLLGQVQALMNDRATLQFVVSQIRETDQQKVLFENNIAFLETEGDKTSGWLNANQFIRTAYSNVEVQRTLISQNTAKFLGLNRTRTDLIERWDALVSSQEPLRRAFMAWADLNRKANADPFAPSTERDAYLETKNRTLALWEELKPASERAVKALTASIERTDKDIVGLQAAIRAKEE